MCSELYPNENVVADAILGTTIMPLCGDIKYATSTSVFSLRTQSPFIACYKAKQTFDDMAQYWIQYRNVHQADVKNVVKFPNIGIVYTKKETEHKWVAKPTSPVTNCMINCFVCAYESLGMAYQRYENDELGKYTLTELIQIDACTQQIVIHTLIENG